MRTGNYDQISGQNSLQIRKEDKFFSRLLSKEANSMANSSFRVYYGGASGAVPFRWESTPGTPKHPFSETSVPPLTPPPSYYFSANSHSKKSSKQTLLASFFSKKNRHSPSFSLSSGSSSSSSLSSWSSRSSCSSSPAALKRRRLGKPAPGSPGSPTSSLCFGSWRKWNGFRGCYRLVCVKNALFSIVGHGSGGRGSTVN